MGAGTLYGTLNRLVEDGLIEETTDRVRRDDSERRRYYTLTADGRAVAVAELVRLQGMVHRHDIETAIEWARAEGWNPGLSDAMCFRTVDREGFLGGYLNGELIASISVVNYDEAFAFVGCYIVRASHRGRGHGYTLWQTAMRHAGSRLIGLDGVLAQTANYERSGFQLAYRNVRYGGQLDTDRAPLAPGSRLVGVGELSLAELATYDRTCFPARRDDFLSAWTTTAGHRALALLASDTLAGYGVCRQCHVGQKIGPLFANDAGAARALLLALAADTAPGPIVLDVPQVAQAAVALAEDLGMTPVFETARMYTGPSPAVAMERIFGVSTFELG